MTPPFRAAATPSTAPSPICRSPTRPPAPRSRPCRRGRSRRSRPRRRPPKLTVRLRTSRIGLTSHLRPDGSISPASSGGAAPFEGLARVEGVAHALEDEDQQRQHDREGEEGGEAQPRRLQVVLGLQVSSPSDGAEEGRPKPRKSSEASAPIVPVTMKGRKVSVATIALGSMWRNMIVQFDTPSARAARTYSKLRARRNSARTTPTSPSSRTAPSGTPAARKFA
jgi:hypothetical protein